MRLLSCFKHGDTSLFPSHPPKKYQGTKVLREFGPNHLFCLISRDEGVKKIWARPFIQLEERGLHISVTISSILFPGLQVF